MQRRNFLKLTAASLAAPYVLTAAPTMAATARANGKLVRRNVMLMAPDDPFFAKYAEAVDRMHKLPDSDRRQWRNQALIHLNHCPHSNGPDLATQFVHWHRWYLAFYEQICGALIGDPDFALPYWDWSTNRGQIPAPFYDIDQLNVTYWKDKSDASSDNWGGGTEVTTIGTRGLKPGEGLQDRDRQNGADNFSADEIDAILRSSTFTEFTSQLESSPHNVAHMYVGVTEKEPWGHMSDGMSPLDPIFWLHHANVDRVWAEWEAASPTPRTPGLDGNYAGQFCDAEGRDVANATSAEAVDLNNFNYTYDTLIGRTFAAADPLAARPTGEQTLLSASAVRPELVPLGDAKVTDRVAIGEAASATVAVGGLVDKLFDARVFWAPNALGAAPSLGAEGGRVYATLTLAEQPLVAPLLVNVYVNKPDLSVSGPNDPYYAGSFSFFGSSMGTKHAMPMRLVVDVTEPLRRQAEAGALTSKDVTVQLVAVSAVGDSGQDVSFVLQQVELSAS